MYTVYSYIFTVFADNEYRYIIQLFWINIGIVNYTLIIDECVMTIL